MNSASVYFTDRYPAEVAELARVSDLIARVLSVFQRTYATSRQAWPYTVEADDLPAPAMPSTSTNAMIAFAVLAALGKTTPSPLLPHRWTASIPGGAREGAGQPWQDADWGALAGYAAEATARLAVDLNESRELRSGTFGTNDPFTCLWLLESLRAVRNGALKTDTALAQPEIDLTTIAAALETLEDIARGILARPKPTRPFRALRLEGARVPGGGGPTTPFEISHPFPLLRLVHLERAIDLSLVDQEAGSRAVRRSMGPTHGEKGASSPASASVARTDDSAGSLAAALRPFFLDRVRFNLAEYAIPDSPFDAADLVFSLEGLLLTGHTPDERLVETVFRVLSESQQRDAYWRPVRPFLATTQGHILLPLSIETANSLLRICRLLEAHFPERSFFSEQLGLFSRYAQWLRSRAVEILRSDEPVLIGWHSEHILSEERIDLWETSQVLLFLALYADSLQRHIARQSRAAAGLSITSNATVAPSLRTERWASVIDIKEPLLNEPHNQVLKDIERSFVAPRAGSEGLPPDYSMLLFGPPGTGKTAIAEDLAKVLGYSLITITPSDFLASGPNEVEARAKIIFETLQHQSECVILFDEIDRLILDRDSKLYREQGDAFQFMTPSMLVKLKTLRTGERSIFVIATNYYERIDPAARRTGRIDQRYLVMPPNRARRRAIIQSLAGENGVTSPSGQDLEMLLNVTSLWAFGELKTLVRDSAKAVARQDDGEAIAKGMLKQAMDRTPSLRIATYWGRFSATLDAGEQLPTAQEPVEEFVAVLELVREAESLDKALKAHTVLTNERTRDAMSPDLRERADQLLNDLQHFSHESSQAEELP